MFWKPVILALAALVLLAAPACGCTGAAAEGIGFAGLGLPLDVLGADAAYWAPDQLNDAVTCFSYSAATQLDEAIFANKYRETSLFVAKTAFEMRF